MIAVEIFMFKKAVHSGYSVDQDNSGQTEIKKKAPYDLGQLKLIHDRIKLKIKLWLT